MARSCGSHFGAPDAVKPAFFASRDQIRGTYPEWGDGFESYMKRFGSRQPGHMSFGFAGNPITEGKADNFIGVPAGGQVD